MPTPILGVNAVDPEPVRSIQGGKVEACGETRIRSEDDIGLASRASARWIGEVGADDDVVNSIAIDVPGGGYGRAAIFCDANPIQSELVGAVEGGEVKRGGEIPGADRAAVGDGVGESDLAISPRPGSRNSLGIEVDGAVEPDGDREAGG